MLEQRIRMCARKGFDSVDLDDIGGFETTPSTAGFGLTPRRCGELPGRRVGTYCNTVYALPRGFVAGQVERWPGRRNVPSCPPG